MNTEQVQQQSNEAMEEKEKNEYPCLGIWIIQTIAEKTIANQVNLMQGLSKDYD